MVDCVVVVVSIQTQAGADPADCLGGGGASFGGEGLTYPHFQISPRI